MKDFDLSEIDFAKMPEEEQIKLLDMLKAKEAEDNAAMMPGMAEGMAREAFVNFLPGGQFAEAGLRSLVGPESLDEELETVRKKQELFREDSPRAAMLAGTAGGVGQMLALGALTGGTGALASGLGRTAATIGGRAALGAGEQLLQTAGEGGGIEEAGQRAAIGGALNALVPIAPKSFQTGLAAGSLAVGLASPEDSAAGAIAGGLTGLGAGKIAKSAPQILASKYGRKWLSSISGLENNAKTLANWMASLSLGGTSKNISTVYEEPKMKLSKARTKQQEIGKQALETGIVLPGKSKNQIYKDINGAFTKDSDLSLVREGIVDGVDAPIVSYKDTRTEVGGIIANLSKTADESISNFEKFYKEHTGKNAEINVEDLVAKMYGDLDEKIKLGGVTPEDAKAIKKEIKDIFAYTEKKVKVPQIPGGEEIVETKKAIVPSKGVLGETVFGEGEVTTSHVVPREIKNDYVTVYEPKHKTMSLSDLNIARKKIGAKLSDKNFLPSREQANAKDAMVSIYRGLKEFFEFGISEIEDSIAEQLGIPVPRHSDTFAAANASISKLMKISEFLDKELMANDTGVLNIAKKFSLPISSTIAGGLFGGPVGAVLSGIGTYALQNYVKNKLPQQTALALNGFKAPKTIKDMITYKDMIATKIALAGNMPLAAQFLSAANNNNEADVEKMMPTISNEHPDIFPSTEYKSEYIDSQGQRKVTDSVDKEIIRNQIRSDENMSNYEKAMKTQKLNRSGVIEGPKQAPNQLMLESMKYFKRPGGSEYLKMLQDKMKKPSDLNPTAKKQTSGVEDFMNRLQETHLEKLQRLAREKKGQ